MDAELQHEEWRNIWRARLKGNADKSEVFWPIHSLSSPHSLCKDNPYVSAGNSRVTESVNKTVYAFMSHKHLHTWTISRYLCRRPTYTQQVQWSEIVRTVESVSYRRQMWAVLLCIEQNVSYYLCDFVFCFAIWAGFHCLSSTDCGNLWIL